MKSLLMFAIALTLVSCRETILYHENAKDFKDHRWMASDVKSFEFELEREINAGDIVIALSHVHDPQFTSIPIDAVITHPTGEKENIAVMLELRDKEGNDLSECLGDVCDLYTPLKDNVQMSKGKYRVDLYNRFPNIYLPNAVSVGISVETDN